MLNLKNYIFYIHFFNNFHYWSHISLNWLIIDYILTLSWFITSEKYNNLPWLSVFHQDQSLPGDGGGWRRWASCKRPFPCQSPATTCPLVITILSWSLDLGSCSINFWARHQKSWVPAVHFMSVGEIFSSFSNLTLTWFLKNFLHSEFIVELYIYLLYLNLFTILNPFCTCWRCLVWNFHFVTFLLSHPLI